MFSVASHSASLLKFAAVTASETIICFLAFAQQGVGFEPHSDVGVQGNLVPPFIAKLFNRSFTTGLDPTEV